MVALYAALAVVGLLAMAEWMHGRRCARIAPLAFGPSLRPARWVRWTPLARIVAGGLVGWGLVTLLFEDPKLHSLQDLDPKNQKNLILVVDVSPSMYLKDAGPEKQQPRRERVAELITSMFNRMPLREYRISLIGFYTGAKPLLERSNDFEIIRYFLTELPTYMGFTPGKTDLYSGLQMAAEMAKRWNANSTTLIVLTDGVSVPAEGMPRMPVSINHILVVGVGDPIAGKFIDGHQSRQDVNSLRQIANRLHGVYHDGNVKHIPTTTIGSFVSASKEGDWWKFSRREMALAATFAGATVLSILPLLLHRFGTRWRPGVGTRSSFRAAESKQKNQLRFLTSPLQENRK